MMQSDLRYRIDTLIKCAKTTTDDFIREEWLGESINLLDELEIVNNKLIHDDSMHYFLKNYANITDGKSHNKYRRSAFYEYYISCRNVDSKLPFLTRHQFCIELKKHKIKTREMCGIIYVNALPKYIIKEEK